MKPNVMEYYKYCGLSNPFCKKFSKVQFMCSNSAILHCRSFSTYWMMYLIFYLKNLVQQKREMWIKIKMVVWTFWKLLLTTFLSEREKTSVPGDIIMKILSPWQPFIRFFPFKYRFFYFPIVSLKYLVKLSLYLPLFPYAVKRLRMGHCLHSEGTWLCIFISSAAPSLWKSWL